MAELNRICSAPGCGNEFHAKGLCHIHYKRSLHRGLISRTEFDNSGPCSVEGCGTKAQAKGLCGPHYRRMRKYGDPLGTSPIYGQAQRYIAEFALKYQGDDCLIWPFSRNNQGYATYTMHGTHSVSRAICAEVHGEPPTPAHEAAHSCGHGHLGCVNQKHLRWATREENQADRLVHGTHMRGERGQKAYSPLRVYLSDAEVAEIKALEGHLSQTTIAKIYGVHRTQVGRIHRGSQRADVMAA